jgi:hypothetical protein
MALLMISLALQFPLAATPQRKGGRPAFAPCGRHPDHLMLLASEAEPANDRGIAKAVWPQESSR